MAAISNSQITDPHAQLRLHMAESNKFFSPYVVMNIFATAIATYGLLDNSPAVVIGAMIISMLFEPITAVSLGLVDGDKKLLLKSSLTLLNGIAIVLGFSFIFGIFFKDLPLTNEIMTRTAPNLLDLLIALAAGAAGTYATVSPRLSGAVVGVAISIALVPPLSCCGILLSRGELELAMGALLFAFINILAIQVAGSFVLWVMGIRHRHKERLLIPNLMSIVIFITFIVIMVIHLINLIQKDLFKEDVKSSLEKSLVRYPGNYLSELKIDGNTLNANVVQAVIRGPTPLTADQVGEMEDQLHRLENGSFIKLRIHYIRTLVMSRNGPLFLEKEKTN